MMAKTALFVAYMFPPAGGVGVIRAVKFIRYLHELGWRVIVLTVNAPATAFYDETLFDELPDDMLIYRTEAFQPTAGYFAKVRHQASAPTAPRQGGWLKNSIRRLGRAVMQNVMLPDEKIGWLPYAVPKGQEILAKHPVDVIFSSGAPFSVHSIANRLSRHSGIPWIADFRDPFLEGVVMKERFFIQRWLLARMERAWVKQASRVVCTTEPTQAQFIQRYPDLPAKKWVVIYNGYDENNFKDIKPLPESNQFELHHIGSLYEGMNASSFVPLFEGIQKWLEHQPSARKSFRLIFTGKIDKHFTQHLLETAQHYGLSHILILSPPVSHSEAIARMMNATALLTTLSHDEAVKVIINVKIFEYLRAHKPILALLPSSLARDVLSKMDGASLITPDDSEAIANQLEAWFTAWQAGTLTVPQNHGHERFERRALTTKLAQLFDDAISEATSKS